MNPTSSQALGISTFAHLRARNIVQPLLLSLLQSQFFLSLQMTPVPPHQNCLIKIPFAFLMLLAQSRQSTHDSDLTPSFPFVQLD